MKRLILPILCMTVMIGCTTEKVAEPTTLLYWFTPYVFSPEYITGQVKSIEQRAYWATEQDGEYIQGALITEKERDSIGWSDDFIVYFDSLGLTKKVEYLDPEGGILGYWKIHYEEENLMKSMWIQGDSSWAYWKYFYDEAGHLSSAERYRNEVDTLLNGFNYKTNENGLFTWAERFSSSAETGNSFSFEFNDAGLVTARESKTPEGEVRNWMKNTYDEKGFMIKMEGMGTDSTMLSVDMIYTDIDEKGNWLKMVSLEEGKVVGIDVRTIVYY